MAVAINIRLDVTSGAGGVDHIPWGNKVEFEAKDNKVSSSETLKLLEDEEVIYSVLCVLKKGIRAPNNK